MKKVIYFFALIISICFVICSSTLPMLFKANLNENNLLLLENSTKAEELPAGLYAIDLFNNSNLTKDCIKFSITHVSKVEIESFVVQDNGKYSGGEILDKGTIINGVKYEERLLVLNVFNGFLFLSKIDSTYIDILLKNKGFYYSENLIDYENYVVFDNEIINSKILNIKNENNDVTIRVHLENNGTLFDGNSVKSFLTYYLQTDSGYYLPKASVQFEEDKSFIYVQTYYKQREYMKRINVNILDSVYDFYRIDGENLANGLKVFY